MGLHLKKVLTVYKGLLRGCRNGRSIKSGRLLSQTDALSDSNDTLGSP